LFGDTVCVQRCDKFRAGYSERGIASGGETAIFVVPYDRDFRISSRYRSGVVPRSIVDYEYLRGLERLADHALN
jgi:hypothetical protein